MYRRHEWTFPCCYLKRTLSYNLHGLVSWFYLKRTLSYNLLWLGSLFFLSKTHPFLQPSLTWFLIFTENVPLYLKHLDLIHVFGDYGVESIIFNRNTHQIWPEHPFTLNYHVSITGDTIPCWHVPGHLEITRSNLLSSLTCFPWSTLCIRNIRLPWPEHPTLWVSRAEYVIRIENVPYFWHFNWICVLVMFPQTFPMWSEHPLTLQMNRCRYHFSHDMYWTRRNSKTITLSHIVLISGT